MIVTFLGHSCVLVETGGKRVVFDPFVEGNPLCPVRIDDLSADVVVLTHAHGDHSANALDLARKGATVVATVEIAQYLSARGAGSVHAMNLGGRADLGFASVRLTPAWHSSSFPDGTYGGMPAGAVLEAEGKRVYHAGDTALFGDMRLIGERGLDLALVPIGDNFTMGPDDALAALELLRPTKVVPIHYDTFPPIRQDALGFAARAQSLGVEGLALRPGATLEL